MRFDPWGRLRDARYAFPWQVGRYLRGPDAASAARMCRRLHRMGLSTTAGFFHSDAVTPDDIVAANLAVIRLLGHTGVDAYLSVKAPPLGFDPARLRTIAQAASRCGMAIVFDAHGPAHADATLAAVEALLADYPGTGCVLPARWRRSPADALRFHDTSCRIRVVKGEWADPDWPDCDSDEAFLALVARLAGRRAPVAVATHKPELVRPALAMLRAAGTPCELEQLRGLPRRTTTAVAQSLGVPVRVYVPFGPGWWPYAIDKALARPYQPAWLVRDWLGGAGRSPEPVAPPGRAT